LNSGQSSTHGGPGSRSNFNARSHRNVVALVVAWTSVTDPACADIPAFDRPGIAFSPTTLPAGSFAWEQGLPDFQRDRADGVTQRAYSASTRWRYGVERHRPGV